MKNYLIIVFLSFTSLINAQEAEIMYYDTLFYTAGYSKPVRINYVENKKVFFTRTTKKGIVSKSSAAFSSLEYYVDYDSTGTVLLERNDLIVNTSDTSKFYFQKVVDTVLVPRHHLSLNPFSIPTLGLSLDYLYRFGKKKQVALHIPFALNTFFGNTFIFKAGIGTTFIPLNSKKGSLTVGGTAMFYIVEETVIVGFPFTMGFMRNIAERLTVNGYIGAGPYFTTEGERFGAIVPDVHFGIGYKFGKYFETTNEHSIKVAK